MDIAALEEVVRMPALIRYAAFPVVALVLIGLGFGAGASHAQDAPSGPSETSADIAAMVEDCQRHMETMAPMMEDMGDMMGMMGTMDQMMDAPGMDRMMDAPAMDRMMGAPGMDRMMQSMR